MALQLPNIQTAKPISLLDALNQGFGTVQEFEKTRMYPQLLQAEAQKGLLGGLPDLDKAFMVYNQFRNSKGENDPATQEALSNYRLMQRQQQTLADWRSNLTQTGWFKSLPDAYKQTVLASTTGAGTPIPGTSDVMGASGGAGITPTLPMSENQISRLRQIFPGGQMPTAAAAPQESVATPTASPTISAEEPTGSPTETVAAPISTNEVALASTPSTTAKTQQQIYEETYSPAGKKAQEEMAKINTEKMHDLFEGTPQGGGGYNRIEDSARNSLNDIEFFHKSYKDAVAKGGVKGWMSFLDPQAQVAQKSASQLILSNMGALKGVVQRMNQMEFQQIVKGNLSPNLDPQAEERIYEQQKLAAKTLIAQANLAQRLKPLIQNKNVLQSINGYTPGTFDQAEGLHRLVDYISTKHNPVDSNGNPDYKQLAQFEKYATPDAIKNILEGKDYKPKDDLPEGLTDDDIAHNMQKYGKTRQQIISKYKEKYSK